MNVKHCPYMGLLPFLLLKVPVTLKHFAHFCKFSLLLIPKPTKTAQKQNPKIPSTTLFHPLTETPNKDKAKNPKITSFPNSFPETNHIPNPNTIANPRNPSLLFLFLPRPSNPSPPNPFQNPNPPPLPPPNSLITNASGSGKMLRFDATKRTESSMNFLDRRYPFRLLLFRALITQSLVWIWFQSEDFRLGGERLEGVQKRDDLIREKLLHGRKFILLFGLKRRKTSRAEIGVSNEGSCLHFAPAVGSSSASPAEKLTVTKESQKGSWIRNQFLFFSLSFGWISLSLSPFPLLHFLGLHFILWV